MRLIMLGTGHAMVTECYNTCFVLEDDAGDTPDGTPCAPPRLLLVDAGGGNGILRQLKRAGIDPCDVRDVFVTHRHLDHLMGVVWLLRTWSQRMAHGSMEGEVRIYAHDEVCQILSAMARMLLNPPEAALMGERIHLVELADAQPLEVAGRTLIPFDIRSTKAKQFGFRLELDAGRWLTCCGDEPLPPELHNLARNSDWLLHEAFCLSSRMPAELLARMRHSSVADACTTAQALGAKNLVLYHATDEDLPCRRERFVAEGAPLFSGNLFVPYDLDVIDLD